VHVALELKSVSEYAPLISEVERHKCLAYLFCWYKSHVVEETITNPIVGWGLEGVGCI